MFEIITFGSATRDTFLKIKKEKNFLLKNPKLIEGAAFYLPLDRKIEIEKMSVFSGGGGTNTAATFSRQGFRVAFIGKIGDDKRGEAIIEELKEYKIDTKYIIKSKNHLTAYSLILTTKKGERVILTYRGASDFLEKKDIPWEKIKKTRWFYLAPFSGKSAELTEPLINFAKKNKIKVAFNPGYIQLSFSQKILKRILKKVDILILNQKEASLLTKIPYRRERDIFRKIDELCDGIFVMTKGKRGVTVSDGIFIYKAKALSTKVVGKTGAGDAFASGFLSGFLKSQGNIKIAIQLGVANAANCIQRLGAKEGLLKRGEKWKKVKVKKLKII